MTIQSRRRRCTPPQFLAAIAAALLVGAPFASVAHLIAVPHETCPEHGELVHGGHDAARSAGANDAQEDTGAGGNERGHEHDHCLLASAANVHATSTEAPAVLAVAPRTISTPFGFEERLRGAAPGLYRLAPKTSPPA